MVCSGSKTKGGDQSIAGEYGSEHTDNNIVGKLSLCQDLLNALYTSVSFLLLLKQLTTNLVALQHKCVIL